MHTTAVFITYMILTWFLPVLHEFCHQLQDRSCTCRFLVPQFNSSLQNRNVCRVSSPKLRFVLTKRLPKLPLNLNYSVRWVGQIQTLTAPSGKETTRAVTKEKENVLYTWSELTSIDMRLTFNEWQNLIAFKTRKIYISANPRVHNFSATSYVLHLLYSGWE